MNSDRTPGAEKLKKCPACQREFVGTIVVCQFDGTLLIPVIKDVFIGTKVADKYEVLSEIGRGGMSIVYKARHELMDRTVAIKMLQAGLVNDQTSIKRFQQEAQAASCLTHPNVITVYDYGLVPSGQPYLVMDFLVGESLSDVVLRDGFVNPLRAITIFVQACDALEHAHQKGVLHRDLKCGNIMLADVEGQKDVVKVVDFGIAKLMPSSGKQQQNLTQTGEVFGSPIYMSPEQCLGEMLDARSDIYSMGTMLYEALTGQPPLMGDTIIDTMQMHVSTKPPSFAKMRPGLSIPSVLEEVCLKALEKNPGDRFISMAAFRDALINCAMRFGNQAVIEENSPRFTPRSTRQGILEARVPSNQPNQPKQPTQPHPSNQSGFGNSSQAAPGQFGRPQSPNAGNQNFQSQQAPNQFGQPNQFSQSSQSNPTHQGNPGRSGFSTSDQDMSETSGSLFGDAPQNKLANPSRATGKSDVIAKRFGETDGIPSKRINANYSESTPETGSQRNTRKNQTSLEPEVKRPGKTAKSAGSESRGDSRKDSRENSKRDAKNGSKDSKRSKPGDDFESKSDAGQKKSIKTGMIILIVMMVLGLLLAAGYFFMSGNH